MMYTIKIYKVMALGMGLEVVHAVHKAETIKELSFAQVTMIAQMLDRLDQKYEIKP